jgi:hypothetical protein
MSDKKTYFSKSVNAQPDMKQLNTSMSKYEKVEFMLLKWFKQKWTLTFERKVWKWL